MDDTSDEAYEERWYRELTTLHGSRGQVLDEGFRPAKVETEVMIDADDMAVLVDVFRRVGLG